MDLNEAVDDRDLLGEATLAKLGGHHPAEAGEAGEAEDTDDITGVEEEVE